MTSDRDLIEQAIKGGDLAALAEFADVLDSFPQGADPQGGSWLASAVASGGIETVRWMLDRGASPNPIEPDGFTLLQICLDRTDDARYDILALLLEHGFDPDARGFNDWTALHHAAARDDFRAIVLLIDAGADRTIRTRIDDHATAEQEARILGRLKAADLIRDHQPPRRSSDLRPSPPPGKR